MDIEDFVGYYAEGQGIIMADGTVKKIEELKVGDQVMGDDNTRRSILEISTGRKKMYKITPYGGDTFFIGKGQVLVLSTERGHRIQIPIEKFLTKNNDYKRDYQLYTKPLLAFQRSYKKYEVSPYNKGKAVDQKTTCLPLPYKCGSLETRLQFLAGILDSKCCKKLNTSCYIFATDSEQLAQDFTYLCRSLGFWTCEAYGEGEYAAPSSVKTKYNQVVTNDFIQFMTGTNGERELPYHKYQIKPSLFHFKVEEAGIKKYYELKLGGNKMFLLDSFLVVCSC